MDEEIQQIENVNKHEGENNQQKENEDNFDNNSNNNSPGNKNINIDPNHDTKINNNLNDNMNENNNLENNINSEKENIENKNNENNSSNKDIIQKENIEDNCNLDGNINIAKNINLNNGININKEINMNKNINNNPIGKLRNGNDNDNGKNIINIKNTNLNEEKNNINKNQKEKNNDYQIYNKTNLNNNIVHNINESIPVSNYSFYTPKKIEEETYFYNDKINYTYKPKKIKTVEQKPTIYINKNVRYALSKSNNSALKRKRDIYSPLEGNIIHDKSELELISNKIHGTKYKIYFNLLYKASQDKDNSSVFHRKCDSNQTTLTLIEDKKGNRFGGFTKRTWKGKDNDKFDNDAFVFSLNKKKIYNVIKGKNAIGCYPSLGPIFCGAFKIYDNAFSKGGCSFAKGLNFETLQDFELTNGEEKFEVKEIEVYEIKIA